MFLWILCLRQGQLTGLKIVLKESLKGVPGFGWATQVRAGCRAGVLLEGGCCLSLFFPVYLFIFLNRVRACSIRVAHAGSLSILRMCGRRGDRIRSPPLAAGVGDKNETRWF